MMMVIRASLWAFRKQDKRETPLPPEHGGESAARSGHGDGDGFADSCYRQGPEIQFQAEEPCSAPMATGCTRMWIAPRAHSTLSSPPRGHPPAHLLCQQ